MIMIDLPDNIVNRICINAILLKKRQNGWDAIHKFIEGGRLCLKMTFSTFKKSMKYYKIERVISVIFYSIKPYVWLKSKFFSVNKYYCYDSPTIRINDLYCMDDFGNFYDDDYDED